MTNKIIFLDVDGVLNSHAALNGGVYCGMDPKCVLALNYLLEKTEAKVVLSSAWRYMILGKAMTLLGFAYLMHTHGVVAASQRLVGTTCSDETCCQCGKRHGRREAKKRKIVLSEPIGFEFLCLKCGEPTDRAGQILKWVSENEPKKYVVIDDCDMGFTAKKIPFIQTNGRVGLTMSQARLAVKMLK